MISDNDKSVVPFAQVRLLAMDVDGVLTDGKIYYGSAGMELKAFDAQDGQGLNLLRGTGIVTAVLSGKDDEAVRRRMQDLHIDHVYLGLEEKLPILDALLERHGLKREEVAYIGDDVGDREVMQAVGLPIAVSNAHASIRQIAAYITRRPGGNGAVREVCDLLLASRHRISVQTRESSSEISKMEVSKMDAPKSPVSPVSIGPVTVGGQAPLALIAGPCVIESRDHCLRMAEALRDLSGELNLPFIFKSSFDKANRTSLESYRGPGLEEGLRILEEVKRQIGVPVLSDVHEVAQVNPAAEVLDGIQIPAFLCRQTDLLVAAGRSGRPVNVKKGQFMAPEDMAHTAHKVASTGNSQILLTERGTCFGYHNLVVDMRSLSIMRRMGYPVVFDATHSVQLPGGAGGASSGQREFVPVLARAAVAAGVDALFMEVHDDPERALCDGPNMVDLPTLRQLLTQIIPIDRLVRS